jgi:hypothetical protein
LSKKPVPGQKPPASGGDVEQPSPILLHASTDKKRIRKKAPEFRGRRRFGSEIGRMKAINERKKRRSIDFVCAQAENPITDF